MYDSTNNRTVNQIKYPIQGNRNFQKNENV